jgi:hypothetical protein
MDTIIRDGNYDLTFGAEAQVAIDHLLSSLRADSFHHAIGQATDLQGQIALADRMLTRLSRF